MQKKRPPLEALFFPPLASPDDYFDPPRNPNNSSGEGGGGGEAAASSSSPPWDWIAETTKHFEAYRSPRLKQCAVAAIAALRLAQAPPQSAPGGYSILKGRNALIRLLLDDPTCWLCFDLAARMNIILGGKPLAPILYSSTRLEAVCRVPPQQRQMAAQLLRSAQLLEALHSGSCTARDVAAFLKRTPPSLRSSAPVAHVTLLAALEFPSVAPRARLLARRVFGRSPPLVLLPILASLGSVPSCWTSAALERLSKHHYPDLCAEIWPFLAIQARDPERRKEFVDEVVKLARNYGRADLAGLALRGLRTHEGAEDLFEAALAAQKPPVPLLLRYQAAYLELMERNAAKALDVLPPAIAGSHLNAAVLEGVLLSSAASGASGPSSSDNNQQQDQEAAVAENGEAAQRRVFRGSRLLAQAARLSCDPVPLYLWALSLFNAGYVTAVEPLLTVALDRQPLQLEFRWLRALVLAKLGRYAAAQSDLRVVAALLRRGAAAAGKAAVQHPQLMPLRVTLEQKANALSALTLEDLLPRTMTTATTTIMRDAADPTAEDEEEDADSGGGNGGYSRATLPPPRPQQADNVPLLKRQGIDQWLCLLRGESAQALRTSDDCASPSLRALLSGHAARYARLRSSPATPTSGDIAGVTAASSNTNNTNDLMAMGTPTTAPPRYNNPPLTTTTNTTTVPVNIPGLTDLFRGQTTALPDWLEDETTPTHQPQQQQQQQQQPQQQQQQQF